MTKTERRRENLLAGKLTPNWIRNHSGAPMRQFRRQFNRAAR